MTAFPNLAAQMSRTSASISPINTASESPPIPDFDISSYCVGSPHHINDSSSSSIQLLLSLQENVIFLPCPRTVSPSSYGEHDNGLDNSSNDPLADSPEIHRTQTSDSINESSPRRRGSSFSASRRNMFRRRRDSTSSNASFSSQNEAVFNDDRSPRPAYNPRRPPKYIKNLLKSSIDPGSSSGDLPPAVLRGSLVMKLYKPTKIKDISLKFYGRCKTTWLDTNYFEDQDLVVPNGPEFQDEVLINSHTWEFSPHQPKASNPSSIVNFDGFSVVSSDLLGADVAYIKTPPNISSSTQPVSSLSPGLHFKTPVQNSEPQAQHDSSTSLKNDALQQSNHSSQTSIPQSLPKPDPTTSNSSSSTTKKTSRSFWPFRSSKDTPISGTTDSIFSNVSSTPSVPHTSARHRRMSSKERNAPQVFSLNNIPFFTPSYFKPTSENSGLSSRFNPNGDSATLYPPGEYVFHFTLAIDPRTAESVNCNNGEISYHLEAKVSRNSRFSFSTTGQREVILVRSPPDLSDTTINTPIAVSRQWDNRLHYEIMCPQKYIPLGSSIPLSIKLTPIEKVQVHRIRVQAVESVTYISNRSDTHEHLDPVRKVTLYQVRGKSSEEQNTLNEALSSKQKSKDGSNDKTKKKRVPGNIVNYIDTNSKSKEPITSSDIRSLDSEVLSTTTDVSCDLNFIAKDKNWDSLSSHHFTSPTSNSNYFQYLRPDVTYNPFIHVKHRLQVSFRISKQDPSDPKRRYFEVMIDTPIYILSKHCKNESVELPLYDSIVTSTDSQLNPLRYDIASSVLSNNSSSMVGAVNIPGAVIDTDAFTSPLVRAVSSDISTSPLYDGLIPLSLAPTTTDDDIHPPSFKEALSDPLLIQRPGNSSLISTSSGFTSLNRVLSSQSYQSSRYDNPPPLPVDDSNTASNKIIGSGEQTTDLSDNNSQTSVSSPSTGVDSIDNDESQSQHSTPSDELNMSRSSLLSNATDLSVTPVENQQISIPALESEEKTAAAVIIPPPTYSEIIHETVPLLTSQNSSNISIDTGSNTTSGLTSPSNASLLSNYSLHHSSGISPANKSRSSAGVGIGIGNASSRFPIVIPTGRTASAIHDEPLPSLLSTPVYSSSHPININKAWKQVPLDQQIETFESSVGRDNSTRFDYYMVESMLSSRVGEAGV